MPDSLFSSLPGTPLPVAEVMPALAREWEEGGTPEMAVRASQMNLVLQFGAGVAPEDARVQWEAAMSLAQRHPCRIIILCPETAAVAAAPLRGKLHLGCFIGGRKEEHRSCEVLSLAYSPQGAAALVENQLSVWRESDLPTYHWFHGVNAGSVARNWLPLVQQCRRVLIDSSREGDGFAAVPWPRADMVRDLARARLLPVRQAIGQFLSAYSPRLLVEGLQAVAVRHSAQRSGEAAHLRNWLHDCLEECARQAEVPFAAQFAIAGDCPADACLSVNFCYGTGDRFDWKLSGQDSSALLEATLGGERHTHPLRVPFLDPAHALAEALFF